MTWRMKYELEREKKISVSSLYDPRLWWQPRQEIQNEKQVWKERK